MWLWQVDKRDVVFRVAEKPLCPSFEIRDVALNNEQITVNIIPRFSQIFLPLSPKYLQDDELRRKLENILLHYLRDLDISLGMDARSIALQTLNSELLEGMWGRRAGENYSKLVPKDRQILLNLLYERQKGEDIRLVRLLKTWFSGCLAYRIAGRNKLLLALPQNETEDNLCKINLILELFLPFGMETQIYWQKTPCILDLEEACLDTCKLI